MIITYFKMEDKNNLKKQSLVLFILFFCLISLAYSQENNYAVVSVSNPEIRILSSKIFSWTDKSRYVYDDKRLGGFPLESSFQNDIKNKLTSNGFTFSESLQNASILVGYVLALESSLNDMDINNLYGLNPGFINKDKEKNINKYEKGTVIIDIIEARTNRMIWRGALQGMAEFGIPDNERQKRLRNVADRLLDEFLKQYGNN